MTLSSERLRALFAHPNVKAFYAVVRYGESSLDERAYRMVSGGGEFFDFSRHPYAGLSTKQGGKAAGAPQFIPSTWAEVAEQYSLPDFTPDSQDMGYVARLVYRKAIEPLLAGDFAEALNRCRLEWTSLPGAAESNAKWTFTKAVDLYVAHGGKLAPHDADTQPAAPIVDHSPDPATLPAQEQQTMPDSAPSVDWLSIGGTIATVAAGIFGSPVAGAIVGELVSAFKPVLQEKLTREVGRHTDAATATAVGSELTKTIVGAVTQVTGKAAPDDAIAAVRANPALLSAAVAEAKSAPEKVAAVERAVEAKLVDMAPLLDQLHKQALDREAAAEASRNASADRAAKEPWPVRRALVIGGLALMTLVVVAVLALLILQTAISDSHEPSAAMLTFAAGFLTTVALVCKEMYAWGFGGVVEGSPVQQLRQEK